MAEKQKALVKLGKSYKDTRVYNQDGSKLYSTTIKGVTNCRQGLVFCGKSSEMVFFDSDYSLGVSVSGDVNLKVQRNMKYAHATYLSIDDYNILTNDNNQIIIKVDDDELSIIVCIIRKVNGKYLQPITMNIDQGKINARVYEGGNSYTVPSGTDSYLNEIYVFLENNLKDVKFFLTAGSSGFDSSFKQMEEFSKKPLKTLALTTKEVKKEEYDLKDFID